MLLLFTFTVHRYNTGTPNTGQHTNLRANIIRHSPFQLYYQRLDYVFKLLHSAISAFRKNTKLCIKARRDIFGVGMEVEVGVLRST